MVSEKTQPDPSLGAELVLWATVLVTVLLVLTWIGFLVRIPITRGHFPAAFIATAAIILLDRRPAVRTRLLGLAAAATAVACAVAIAGMVFDHTTDGMGYHQVSTLMLAGGWNPVWDPPAVTWWNQRFPGQERLSGLVPNAGLWTNHYPISAWLLGAAAHAATGYIDVSKWPNTFFMIVASASAIRGLSILGIPMPIAAALGTSAALSPVVVAQLGSTHNDGLLGNVLLLQIGALLAWSRTRWGADLFVFWASFAIGVNIKFTGAVYCALLIPLVIVVNWMRATRWSSDERRAVAIGLVLVVILSVYTYVRNVAGYGHPFYPLNTVDIMLAQRTAEFGGLFKVVQLSYSLFNIPINEIPIDLKGGPIFVRPRLWHYMKIISEPDYRIAGFGTLFGYVLVASLVALLVACCSANRMLRRGRPALVLLAVLVWIGGCAAINPEAWWARYVPQLWFVPLIAGAIFWLLGWRLICVACAGTSLTASMACLIFWAIQTSDRVAEHKILVGRILQNPEVELGGDGDYAVGIFVAFHQLQQAGMPVRLADDPLACKTRFGYSKICLSQH